MKMQTYRNPWLLLAMLLLAAPLAAMAAEPAANSAGPLTWQATSVPPTFSEQKAVKLSGQYLGISGAVKPVATPQFVQVTDSARDGNITKTVYYAWLVTLPGVPVSNANSKANAAIDVSVLVDANDQGLDGAFTAKNDSKWVPRYSSYVAQPPFQVMADNGWNIARSKNNQLNSTVSQVLTSFWSATGINPENAGQIFLRPRYVIMALPAKRAGGKLVPLNPPGTYWPVEVSGTKTLDVASPPSAVPSLASTSTGETPYMTGLIALIADSRTQSVGGMYLP